MTTERPSSEPLLERARTVRDCVERALTEPRKVYQSGNQWERPPVAAEFHLVSVAVVGTHDSPQVEVVFTWNGEDETFGMRFPIRLGDSAVDESPDAFVSVYVEENLFAAGMGIENAERQYGDDGVVWLSWPSFWTKDR